MAILPALDMRETVASNLRKDESLNDDALQALEMVDKEWQRVLRSIHVGRFNAEGEMFDPQRHEAISAEESDSVPAGTVLRQVGSGYLLNDNLIRSAQVIVATAPGLAAQSVGDEVEDETGFDESAE
jgi:molecular chaperone GrpE